jgi:hypothetical protein
MTDHWWWRPGVRPGRRVYVWHILFDGRPQVGRLVNECQSRLSEIPHLDPVPESWLHMTTQIVRFADEIGDPRRRGLRGGHRPIAGRPMSNGRREGRTSRNPTAKRRLARRVPIVCGGRVTEKQTDLNFQAYANRVSDACSRAKALEPTGKRHLLNPSTGRVAGRGTDPASPTLHRRTRA